MFIPKGRHFLGPILTILLGFYVIQRYGPDFGTYFVMVALGVVAFVQSAYIYQAGILYQKYQTKDDFSAVPERERLLLAQERAEGFGLEPMPPIKVYGEPTTKAYDKVMQLPTFNKERNFAITLLKMQEQFEETDLTEEKWVKSGKFTRTEFKAMLGLWEEYGAIGRVSAWEHSTYTVTNWNAVRLIAEGNPLGNKAREATA